MKTHDHELNELEGLSCRTWVFRIMEKIAAGGLVTMTGTVGQLEAECRAHGYQRSKGEAQQQQPRPVVISTICS